MQKIISKICSKIEHLSIPRVNWIKTLYFNFRLLPFKQAKKLPFFIYGNPVFNSLAGDVEFRCPIKRGMVKINYQQTFAPSLQTLKSQICLCGTLIIGGDVVIGCANKILVTKNATLELSHHVQIMDFCNIDCYSYIKLKTGVCVSHRCQIMDTNHHYIVDIPSRTINDNKKDIIIGEYCWVCNSTSINAGAIIPKHTIISSHSLVNKDVSQWGDHILIGGIPVKLLKKGIARVFNVKNELFLFQLSQQSELDSFSIPQHIDIHKFIKYEDDVVL